MIELIKNPPPPPPEYTKTQVRQMARERGLRRYSRLRKSELFQKLVGNKQQKLVGNKEQILDRENDAGTANVSFLTPTPYTPPPEYTKTQLRQMARERERFAPIL